jgi:hypothetical protein
VSELISNNKYRDKFEMSTVDPFGEEKFDYDDETPMVGEDQPMRTSNDEESYGEEYGEEYSYEEPDFS